MDITLFVEHACNLRCSYCYTGEKFKKGMQDDTLEAAIELSFSDRPEKIAVSFFGGEPLLRIDFLRRAVERFESRALTQERKPTLHFCINTNGTLLNDDIVEWMLTHNIAANVSLDGPEDVHDRLRRDQSGHGSYKQTRAALLKLQKAGIRFQLNAVVSPETAKDMGRSAQELLRYQGFNNSLAADLSANWSDQAVADFHQGSQKAADVWRSAFEQGETPHLEPFQRKVLSHVLGGCATAGRCNLALREVTVAPSGHLYSCGQMVGEDRDVEHRIGHVKTGIDYPAIERMRQQKEGTNETCGSCDLRSRCSSECGCRQISATGTLGRIDGIMCETEEAFVRAADRAAESLVQADNAAFQDLVYRTNWRLRDGARVSETRRAPTIANSRGDRPRRLSVIQ